MAEKKWVPVTGNIDPRQLVKAHLWLAQQGVQPQNRNDLLKKCVQLVANQLGDSAREPTLEEAHRFLDEKLPVRATQGGVRVPTAKLSAQSDEQAEFEKAQALAREFGRELTLEQFRANKLGGAQ